MTDRPTASFEVRTSDADQTRDLGVADGILPHVSYYLGGWVSAVEVADLSDDDLAEIRATRLRERLQYVDMFVAEGGGSS